MTPRALDRLEALSRCGLTIEQLGLIGILYGTTRWQRVAFRVVKGGDC